MKTTWDFVEMYYPFYSSCDDIARHLDLFKLTTGDYEDGDSASELLKVEYNNDSNFGMIQVDYDNSLLKIYEKAIENFFAKETEIKKWARQCEVTGEGMNEGFVFGDGAGYCKYEKDALEWAKNDGYKSLQDAYDSGAYYWTEWEDEEDFQYYEDKDGVIHEL